MSKVKLICSLCDEKRVDLAKKFDDVVSFLCYVLGEGNLTIATANKKMEILGNVIRM